MFRSKAFVSMMTMVVFLLSAVHVAMVGAESSSSSSSATTPGVVGIRIVFDAPTATGSSTTTPSTCTNEEHDAIVSIMHEGIADMLEQQRQQQQDARRRALQIRRAPTTPIKPTRPPPVPAPLDFDDDGVSDATDPLFCKAACVGFATGMCVVAYPPCDNTRRLVEQQRPVRYVSDPAEFVRLCHEEQDVVLAAIQDGVEDVVSESCHRLLRSDTVEVTCADLSEQSPVFIPASLSDAAAWSLGTPSRIGGIVVLTTLLLSLLTDTL